MTQPKTARLRDELFRQHQAPRPLAGAASLAAGLLLLAVAPPLAAQPDVRLIHGKPVVERVGPKRAMKIVQDFYSRLSKTDQLLKSGDSKKAYKEATLLLDRMVNSILSGPDVGRLLGLATVLRAMAAYELGRETEALWHWHVATQMFPEASEYQLTAYGDAGAFLAGHPMPEENPSKAPEPGADVKPPRKKNAPHPKIPAAKKGAGRISVVVRVVIDEDGRVREPRIVESRGELTLVCTTLDALRRWEFRPAEKDGETVAVYFDLVVNFTL